MKVHFLGAAQTVTGSCYIVEACGTRFSIDCGMHQGNSVIEARNYETEAYKPAALDFIILTHAHIDHSGLLPRIVHEGFKGPIYCTPPTGDLAALMLEDSAHIQEMEAAWKTKKLSRHSGQSSPNKETDPLYTVEDAKLVPNQFHLVEYGTPFEPHPGIHITYRDAGHILGSAFLEVSITEEGKTTRLVFSGDLGRPGTLLMHDPAKAAPADFLIIESTYGDRNHKNEADTFDEMAEAIAYSYKKKDKVIIPAFAVGRTQEILYCLYLLHQQGRLPPIPIFVDSPLAIRATEVFRKFKEYLEIPEINLAANLHKMMPDIHFTLEASESQALNTMSGPAIIISASGMCNAGRIKHHLRHNAWRPGASLVFVGYQGIGTPGRKIVDGAKSIRLFNEDIAIKAKVYTIGGFSAHADQRQLLDWIEKMAHPGMQVVLVHGEECAQQTLAERIKSRFQVPVSVPAYLEEMELHGGIVPQVTPANEGKSQPRVDWDFIMSTTENNMSQLRTRLQNARQLSWNDQVGIRDRMLELNKELLSVLCSL